MDQAALTGVFLDFVLAWAGCVIAYAICECVATVQEEDAHDERRRLEALARGPRV